MNINIYTEQYITTIVNDIYYVLTAGNINELDIETPQILLQLRSYILSHGIQIIDTWEDFKNILVFVLKTVYDLKIQVLRQFENINYINLYLYSIAKPMVEVLADKDLIQNAYDYDEDLNFYLKNFINTSIGENFNDRRLLITDNEFNVEPLNVMWSSLADYMESVYEPPIIEDIENIDYEPEFRY